MATTRVILLLLIASIPFSESCNGQCDGMVVELNLKINIGGCQKNPEECTTTTPTISTPSTTTWTTTTPTKTKKTTTTPTTATTTTEPTTTEPITTTEPVCLMSMVTQRNLTVTNPALKATITSPGPNSMVIECNTNDFTPIDYSVDIGNNYILKSPLYIFCGNETWNYYTKDLRILPVTTFDCTNADPNIEK